MLSINTNLPSIIAQNSLKQSTLKLNTAIERMTTGYKINGAKDNAANYSIATNMTTKIGAYQIAEDNCAMGLDLITTASESLDLINDKLVRLRALAEQSANGTYGEQSLKAINAEANALVDEIERSYKNTEYNGIKLFGESKSQFIEEVVKRDTSSMTTLASVDENTTISSGTYSISTAEELAKLATMTNDGKVSGGEFVLANDIDLSAYSSGEGWMPIGNHDTGNLFQGNFDGNGYVISNLFINRIEPKGIGLFGSIDSGEIKNLGIVDANVTGYGCVGALAGYTLGSISNCYVTGSVSAENYAAGLIGTSEGSITNSYSMCEVIGIGSCTTGGLVGECPGSTITNSYYNIETSGQSDMGKGDGITTAELQALLANGALRRQRLTTFQIGINASISSQISVNTNFSIDVTSLRNIGQDNADYLNQIDTFINTVSAKQTEYGAAQNRLESALDEISTQYENLVSSRSTLRDADIAEVSSEYIRQQILQQASATLLSTANQTPALALQLL